MKKSLIALAIACAAAGGITAVRAADDSSAAKKQGAALPCCPMAPKAAASLEKLKGLTGTWAIQSDAKDEAGMTVVFRPTSNGTAVIETMFPGSDHEMINMFTADGDSIVMTHYCAMGNQPRMKLAPASGEGKAMKFEFVDGGNIKSRNEMHMDGVTLTIDGDKLSEDWSSYADGKVLDHKVFELRRQK